jgi:hypothetical protein
LSGWAGSDQATSLTISYLYFPPLVYGQIHDAIVHAEGFAQGVTTLPTFPIRRGSLLARSAVSFPWSCNRRISSSSLGTLIICRFTGQLACV